MFYYKQELPESVLDIFKSPDDPMIISQDFSVEDSDKLQESLPEIVNKLCLEGRLPIIATKNVAVLIKRKTAWVCEIDTKIKKGATVREIINTYKLVYKLLLEQTLYVKCEARTPFDKYAKLMAKAMKADIEGVCKKSFKTREGKMIDEYLVGIVLQREDTQCQQ